MRYGMGNYNEWKENRVTDYDKKTEGAELGLTGWAGNQTVEHHAKILAEQHGKEGAQYGKGTKYWDQAFNQLIRDGRQGADVHGQFRDYQMSEEIADLRSQLEGSSKEEEAVPEAKVEPTELDQGMIDSANERIDNRSEAKSRAQSYKETEAMDDANIENAALQTASEPNNLSDDDQLNVYDNPYDTQRKQSSIASMITGKHAGLG